jgi:hypothetical protein
MEKVTYRSPDGQEVDFGQTAPLILQKITGTGGLPYSIQTEKAPYQDGTTFINQDAEERDITLQIAMIGTLAEVYEAKRELQKIINKGQGFLIYQNDLFEKQIEVYAESTPTYATGDRSKGQNYQVATLSFVATEPYWKDLFPYTEFLTRVTPAFHFELEIEEAGIEFGVYTNSIANINNDGDTTAPLTFEFAGPVTDPIIHNETTGEYIKLITPLLADEIMTITTGFGNKSATITNIETGVVTNAFQYLDLGSTFFHLKKGMNKLRFDASAGSADATINIGYIKRYTGL